MILKYQNFLNEGDSTWTIDNSEIDNLFLNMKDEFNLDKVSWKTASWYKPKNNGFYSFDLELPAYSGSGSSPMKDLDIIIDFNKDFFIKNESEILNSIGELEDRLRDLKFTSLVAHKYENRPEREVVAQMSKVELQKGEIQSNLFYFKCKLHLNSKIAHDDYFYKK